MDRTILLVHLLAVCSLVGVGDSSYSRAAPSALRLQHVQADNGHTAKKSPMDYSLYAEDERKITSHGQNKGLRTNMCDGKYTLKNSTIIRTSDSLKFGAIFVGEVESVGPSECRWHCCQKERDCDTAIFVEDESKTKNCFMFKCWQEGDLRCKFSDHRGYISGVIGGFDEKERPSGPNGPSNEVNSDIKKYDSDSTNGKSDSSPTDAKYAEAESESTGSAKETSDADGAACQPDQIQCANRDCIPIHYMCNDIEDCLDGSDEMGCKYDTNTPSSHSSLATLLPNIGPTAQHDDKPRVTQKMDLQEVRSELASELDSQQEHSEQKLVDEGVPLKPGSERISSDGKSHVADYTKDGKANEQLDGNVHKSKVRPQSRNEPPEMHAPGSNMGAHQETGQKKISGGKSGISRHGVGNQRGQDGFNQAESRQENLSKQNDRQVVGQRERYTNPMKTQLQPGPNTHRTGEKGQDTTHQAREDSGYDRYEDGTSHILGQAPGEVRDKERLTLDHSRDHSGYPPRRKNPPRTDMSNNPGSSDRFSPNYYRSDEAKDNMYPYDNYGTAYRNKPYTSQQDYNYDDMFRDLPRHDGNYPDELYDDNPVYQDLPEEGYDPNYHQQNRVNGKYISYPSGDRHGIGEPSQRRHQYEGSPERWDQRGGFSGQSGGRPQVSGRRHEKKLGPADGSSNDNQQNRPGAWKQWNDFNHRVDPWEDDHNSNTNDDMVDSRTGDRDGIKESETQQGVKPGQDWHTKDNSEPEVTVDKEASPVEIDNMPKFTESIVYQEVLADSLTTQLPHSTSKLKQPKMAIPKSTNKAKEHIVGFATPAGEVKSNEAVKPDTNMWDTPHINGGPFSHPAASAVLPLAVGLVITLLLLLMLSCRLRYMNRRLRYGRLKTHAHDADYLINGMYL